MAPHLQAQGVRKVVLVGEDPPMHDRHRRVLNPEFSLKRARAMQPYIESLIDGLVSNILDIGPGVDLVQEFALPIPSSVMSRLLGVPYEDREFFQAATAGMMQARDAVQTQEAGAGLVKYLAELTERQMREPGDGVISRLCERVAAGEISQDEVVQLSLVLIVAGLETTSSMIPLGVITLLEHPDQLAAMTSGAVPMPTAVEELLRVIAVTDFGGIRWVTDDIEGDGYTIKAGDGLVVSSPMTNRDPSVHEDPFVFDIGRGNRQHLSFGYGVHQCIGQNLARLQLEIAYRTLFERIPGLRLGIPASEIQMRATGTIHGVDYLPVEW